MVRPRTSFSLPISHSPPVQIAQGGADGDINKMHTARNILLLGLVIQVITFGIFLFVAVAFDYRSSRSPARKAQRTEMAELRGLWNAFYLTGVLITGRSIYRTIGELFCLVLSCLVVSGRMLGHNCLMETLALVEFASISFTPGQKNPQGYISTHEWVFYLFDTLPIFVSTIIPTTLAVLTHFRLRRLPFSYYPSSTSGNTSLA